MWCTKSRKASNWYFIRCGLKKYRENVRVNVFITSCTIKPRNWYFKQLWFEKVREKSTGNVLECHVLEKQVTNISNVVVSKGTGKWLITSWTRKASNWYFKRCGLKKYRENVRVNVFITSCTEKQLTDISNVVVWKSTEKCFMTSWTRKTSN